MKRLVCLLLSLVMFFPILAMAETDPIAERIENLMTGDDLGYTILEVFEDTKDNYAVFANPSVETLELISDVYAGYDVKPYQEWVENIGKLTASVANMLRMEAEILKIDGIRSVNVTFCLVIPSEDSEMGLSALLIVQADKEENIEVVLDSTGALDTESINFDE